MRTQDKIPIVHTTLGLWGNDFAQALAIEITDNTNPYMHYGFLLYKPGYKCRLIYELCVVHDEQQHHRFIKPLEW